MENTNDLINFRESVQYVKSKSDNDAIKRRTLANTVTNASYIFDVDKKMYSNILTITAVLMEIPDKNERYQTLLDMEAINQRELDINNFLNFNPFELYY